MNITKNLIGTEGKYKSPEYEARVRVMGQRLYTENRCGFDLLPLESEQGLEFMCSQGHTFRASVHPGSDWDYTPDPKQSRTSIFINRLRALVWRE